MAMMLDVKRASHDRRLAANWTPQNQTATYCFYDPMETFLHNLNEPPALQGFYFRFYSNVVYANTISCE
jgi:hypothetical protein